MNHNLDILDRELLRLFDMLDHHRGKTRAELFD